ncbi:MAG TPA: GGDEF domain-containing protein [Noviherbaspirillum sp.]|nr:GGDEF domain-containing protein [Noviherbaspirillum sp.]
MDSRSEVAVPDDRSPAQCGADVARELACVHRALRTLSAGNRTLVRACSEQELLRDMCRVIVETGGYRIACVGYAVDDERKSIRWMASVGTDVAAMAAFNFSWANDVHGHGATGTAIRTGQPVVGRLLSDPVYAAPVFTSFREQACTAGFSSFTAFPLRVEGQVIGALLMGAGDLDAFDEAEVKLLAELADDLGFGIEDQRRRVQHRAAQATIERLAYYDPLTGLPNRARLREKLEEAMQAARQQHRAIALLHLEVGRFHEINKVVGYRAGDELLQELTLRLMRCCTGNEMLARVGEAEFALMIPNSGADHAVKVANYLLQKLRAPVHVAGLALDARAGIGIALFPGHATEADVLIRRANAAMHLAPPMAGGYAMYTGRLEQEYTRRLTLMGDLHRAIAENELRLFCQPKVHIASRSYCGSEALVRWEHPRYGMISPTEFVKLAEQAGTITPLTHWMLEAAFSQSYAWKEAKAPRSLAVNLSVHDLYSPGLVERVAGLFSTWGISSELIQFELTEGALMTDPESALDTLERLKNLGVTLFIDDFGTGYSGLSYLQRLPVDGIKIDQSFVRPMVTSADSEVIVRSTIELGHNLGLKVVAEGVESAAIWERLDALGCDTAQGYLISKPIPAQQLQGWERDWTLGAAQSARGPLH